MQLIWVATCVRVKNSRCIFTFGAGGGMRRTKFGFNEEFQSAKLAARIQKQFLLH